MTPMTPSCAAARELFPAYLDEALPREERSSVRAHLVDCAACRREASALDPALLFAALPAAPVSEADTARILAAVRSGIALKSSEKRVGSAAGIRPRRSMASRTAMTAAAAAAAVAIAWTLAPRPESPRLAPAPASTASATSATNATNTAPFAPFATTGSAGSADAPAENGSIEEAGSIKARGSITGNLPADATVYDWNPGGGQPRVVWIVGRSLDI